MVNWWGPKYDTAALERWADGLEKANPAMAAKVRELLAFIEGANVTEREIVNAEVDRDEARRPLRTAESVLRGAAAEAQELARLLTIAVAQLGGELRIRDDAAACQITDEWELGGERPGETVGPDELVVRLYRRGRPHAG